MIKRRFYKQEHGDKDNDSDSGSSDSDSEVEPEPVEKSESDNEEQFSEKDNPVSSGYESEESSGPEIDGDDELDEADSESEDDEPTEANKQLTGRKAGGKLSGSQSIVPENKVVPMEAPECVLVCKSVFKCKFCPKVLCLSELTLMAHLKSKRHAHAEKLYAEGKLMTMLNSDGEVENQETAMEMNARILALGQESKKKNERRKGGRQRQRMRAKRKMEGDNADKENTKTNTKASEPAKKRKKKENTKTNTKGSEPAKKKKKGSIKDE